MKKLISALSVLLLGFMYSGCTESSLTQVSDVQDRTAIEDGSFVPGDVATLGKKCSPKPECNKEGDNSSGIEYSVVVIPILIGDLKSFCPGLASNKLNGTWFTSDCPAANGDDDPLPLTPFDYTPKDPPADAPPNVTFKGNGSIFIDVRKGTYRFWLWETDNRSDVYETLTQFEADLTESEGVITLHIHESLDMCRKVKNQMLCVGKVNFGDVVYTPKPI